MNDPLVQTVIVAVAINLAAAGIAFYLWTEHPGERFLQFWAIAWTAGVGRWLLHYPAGSSDVLRAAEVILIGVTMLFMVLGSYDLLPSKPWRQGTVVGMTALILAAYVVAAVTIGPPLEMGYALFAAVLAFAGGCMWVAYRSNRLPGYGFAAGTLLYELVVVGILLTWHGEAVADSIVVPLYNIPLMLSIVVIAQQRDRRRLVEAEDRTRRLYVRLANVEDDERRALHAELHDSVGANLAALRMELDVASSLLTRSDDVNAQRHIGIASEVATETMAMARDLMAELRPPALDDSGLLDALRTFARTQSARLSIPIDVTGDGTSSRRDRLVESALFRIAQEAVINAARHASATRIVITVEESDERLLLAVEDDGVGFDAGVSRPDHWGLKNMRERALAVGGVLTVRTSPGEGTRVTAEAPRGDA